jgi:tetratricopeptide (TPR) repeat protein
MLVATVLMAGYGTWSVNTYRASQWAASNDIIGMRKSAALRPHDAQYHARLGRLELVSGDLGSATVELKQATTLNPYDAGFWGTLAEIAEVSGDPDARRSAIERALTADPTTPTILWEAANFHLAAGDIARALPLYQNLLRYDTHFDGGVTAVLAGSSLPADLVLKDVLPARMNAHTSYLQRLLSKKRLADAKKTWRRIVTLREPIPPEAVAPYFNALIDARKSEDLQRAWTETVASNPGMSQPQDGEFVTNGSFEDRLSIAGLDWTFDDASEGNFAIDTTNFHSGLRSLRVEFDGEKSGLNRFRQIVPVEPNGHYQLTLSTRSEELLSASGPRISVTEAYTGQELGTTEELLGSSSWKELKVKFTAGPDTSLIKISLARTSPSLKIRGRMWIDDVSLRVANEN